MLEIIIFEAVYGHPSGRSLASTAISTKSYVRRDLPKRSFLAAQWKRLVARPGATMFAATVLVRAESKWCALETDMVISYCRATVAE